MCMNRSLALSAPDISAKFSEVKPLTGKMSHRPSVVPEKNIFSNMPKANAGMA